MSEFNNRMDAQRKVLEVVNRQRIYKKELCGLSQKAIERWSNENRIDPDEKIVKTLIQISQKLFFLANKSQEQITEDYKLISLEISNLRDTLKVLINTQQ
ncbi:MAG: hypothetical protein DCF12_03115 [Snowella sp.]|jgi:hypothetical protein|nr:MAG: hypothetical protein DCF12_03115 [Snowella sp.]